MEPEFKTCNLCKESFPKTEEYFHYNQGYFNSYCKPCQTKRSSKWKNENKEKYNQSVAKFMSNEGPYIRYNVRRPFKPSAMYPKPNKAGYVRPGWVPEITIKEIYAELLLHIQLMKDKFPGTDGRICRYCEKPWTYIRHNSNSGKVIWTNFSMDRFNAKETYKKGNIVFCCAGCNSIKGNSKEKHWKKFLEVAEELKKQNECLEIPKIWRDDG